MFGKEKVFTTTDIEQKNKIEDILSEHHIEYRIRMKDVNQLHPFHTALMGSMLAGDHKPRYAWDFFVDPKDVEYATKVLNTQ